MVTGISVTSVTLLATILSAFYTPTAPDPKQLDARTKIAYMASKEFTRLPEEEKEKYVKSVGYSRKAYRQLSDNERQEVSKNTRKYRIKQMKERANKFFKMSTDEQNKYLDEMNAKRDKWRKAREARRAKQSSSKTTNNNSSKTNTNRRGGNRNARRQGFLEKMDSTTRAQFMEIWRRARERRKKQKK